MYINQLHHQQHAEDLLLTKIYLIYLSNFIDKILIWIVTWSSLTIVVSEDQVLLSVTAWKGCL